MFTYFCPEKNNLMKQNTSMVLIAIVLIMLAALSRVAFYPNNYSSVVAMALFSGELISHDQAFEKIGAGAGFDE